MAVSKWQPGTIYLPGALVQPLTQQTATINQPENPGFETGTLADWSYSPVGGSASAAVQNQYVYEGTYAFYWPGGSGSGNEGGIECDLVNDERVVVTPGTSITASCRIMYNPTSSPNGSQGRVRIYWYDASNALIGSPSEGNLIKGRGNNKKWVVSTVNAVAPALAAYASIGAWLTTVSGGTFADSFTWNYIQQLLPGLIYRAVQPDPGVSDNVEPTWPQVLGVQVVDNTVIWEAVQANRVTWQASPIMESGATEPVFPTTVGERITDNNITWEAVSRRIEDENCPNSKEVVIIASHVFATDDDIVRECAAANPKDWTTIRNAGYLATGLQQANASGMKVLNQFRSNLVAFNASVFQSWQMDPDPALQVLIDQLPGIGSVWQQAAQPVSNDLFFLAALGVRSVGIAGGTTHLQAGDVGMPVDPIIKPAIMMVLANGKQPRSAFFPSAGQYWLSFADYPPPDVSIAGDFPDLWGTGIPSAFQYTSAGGTSPKVFTITGGALPPGMSLLSNGTITGSTMVVGSYAWEVTVTDFNGNTASKPDGTTIALSPSVTGDAPDGTVGVVYGPFAYGATGGTPPYTFSISEPSTPAGVALESDGDMVGTPTTPGTSGYTVRVTDSLGLYGEKADSVAIGATMMATRIMSGGTSGYYARIDGSWGVTWITTSDFNGRTLYQIKNGSRIFSYRASSEVLRTDDYGTTTALTVANVGGGGGPRLGWFSGNIGLIPGGSGGLVRKSTDNGATIATVAGTPELGLIGKNEITGRWIAMWIDNDVFTSDDNGETFTYRSTLSDATYSVGVSRWSLADGRVCFGGSNGPQTAPKLITTYDGINLVNEALPAFTGGSRYITAIYEWGNYLIVGTELGEVAYKVGNVWTLSSVNMGCTIHQITDNGFEVVMIGGSGPTDTHGFIKSTADMETFTTRYTAALSSGEVWTGITT